MIRLEALVLLLAVSASASAQDKDSTIAPGVIWRHRQATAPALAYDIITIDLKRGFELRQVRARDSIVGREKLTSMVARQPEGAERVLAAINADFFSLATGESENNVVIDGEWWKGVRGTTSPYDAWDNAHIQFGVSATGKPLIDRFAFHGTAIRDSNVFPITALNHFSRGGGEAVVLFTPRYGKTPLDTTRTMAEVPLRRVATRGDTTVFVQTGPPIKAGPTPIPADGAVLAAYGPRFLTVGRFAPGDTIRAVLRAASQRGDGPLLSPRVLMGGWPRILRDGVNVAARAPWDEATISSNAEARHPRSAVGFSRDSTKLFLVTVDGRQAASVGVTLVDLAIILKEAGAWHAMNFDGGGSTTLVVKGAVVNHPSDAAGEREIANALLVVQRKP